MLRITADVFSGRPNPAWLIADDAEARVTLRALTADRDVLSGSEPPDAGLGLRGLRIEPLADELAQDFGLGAAAYLAVGPQAGGDRAAELAERLIALADRADAAGPTEVPPLDVPLRDFLAEQLEQVSGAQARSQVSLADMVGTAGPPPQPSTTAEAEAEAEVRPAVTCFIELGAFNPGFWNDDPNVRWNNNCYNYASNWRTNTFAQPGRGCGAIYTAITCAEMTRAALCDGMHHRFGCFPDTERPRYLVALVVAPGPGFVDFHWYRKQKEGFWGHKPGGTAARNVDNSGVVITDPQFADRGP